MLQSVRIGSCAGRAGAFDDSGKLVKKATTATGVTYLEMAAVPTGPAFVAGSQLADGANTSHLALFIDP